MPEATGLPHGMEQDVSVNSTLESADLLIMLTCLSQKENPGYQFWDA